MFEHFEKIMAQADAFVHDLLVNEPSGHDYEHVLRVVKMADMLSNEYKCDKEIVLITAYLHDVDDPKVFKFFEEKHEHLNSFFQRLIFLITAKIKFVRQLTTLHMVQFQRV